MPACLNMPLIHRSGGLPTDDPPDRDLPLPRQATPPGWWAIESGGRGDRVALRAPASHGPPHRQGRARPRARGRRLGLLWRAEAEVRKDLIDGVGSSASGSMAGCSAPSTSSTAATPSACPMDTAAETARVPPVHHRSLAPTQAARMSRSLLSPRARLLKDHLILALAVSGVMTVE